MSSVNECLVVIATIVSAVPLGQQTICLPGQALHPRLRLPAVSATAQVPAPARCLIESADGRISANEPRRVAPDKCQPHVLMRHPKRLRQPQARRSVSRPVARQREMVAACCRCFAGRDPTLRRQRGRHVPHDSFRLIVAATLRCRPVRKADLLPPRSVRQTARPAGRQAGLSISDRVTV